MLQTDNLHKSYRSRAVVRGVSMQVEPGKVVGLLGPNGAGKTTCFYMIVGLIPAARAVSWWMALTSPTNPSTSARAWV